MTDKKYWLALATLPGIGPRTFAALVEKFGSPRAVFRASADELTEVARVTSEIAAQLRACDFDQVENEIYALGQENITVLTRADEHYPANLAHIPDAPPVLFVRGSLRADDARAVAIIGTREANERGKQIALQLARGFAARGYVVVSGLARGIDTAAHQGALDGNGRTLAVLGSGLRVIHPRENNALADAIAKGHGALLSEFPPNTPPQGRNLMMRDRIISGLARGVIVVQAARDSGSMDTAQRAQKQKRRVFAVRGGGDGVDELLRGNVIALTPDTIEWDEIAHTLDTWRVDAPSDTAQQLALL